MTYHFNRKAITNIFLLFTLLFSIIGRGQDFIWASNTNQQANGSSGIRSIVSDSKGNIYSTGSFSGIVDFDPSTNSSTLVAQNGSSNGFILKLDKNKNFLWVKQIISSWVDGGRSIILDKNENVIITGLATGTQIDLNPDPVDQYMIDNPTGNPGSYIVKLDSDGNFIFGNYYPGAYVDESTLDNDDNIITTGVSGGTNIDFDAGNGIYNLNTKGYDIFILKNNSNGAFIWAKNIGGNGYDYPVSLVCDNLNNIILKGNFENNIKFSNINYSSSYNCNFICKIKSDGQDLWFRQLGNVSGLISNEDKSVKTDYSNNIYFNTAYSSFLSLFIPNFNNINLSFTSNSIDSILFKINENGDYIWHNSIYGNERQEIYSIDLDKNENLYLIAQVNGETFINDDCNQVFPNKNTCSSNEGLLLKFNQAGAFINFKNIVDNAFSMDCDFENNILIGGNFSGGDFDPSPSNSFLMYSSYSDGFNLKLAPCTSAVPEGETNHLFCSSNIPTIADLKPCSEIIDWYDSANSTLALSKSSSVIDNHIYYGAYHESCAGNERLAVTVSITQAPQIPIASNLDFCKSDNAKLSDIVISGQNIKWYANLTDTTDIPVMTLLQNGTTYYATQTVNDCESGRVPITVTINNVPPTTTSPQSFCIQQNVTLNDIAITGQNLKWYDALTAGTLLSNITPLQNGMTYYASQTINGCESERIPVVVNIQNTEAPTGNTTQSFCTSQNSTLSTITISGTVIKWYDNAGILLSDSIALQDGKTYYASQTENNCESTNRLAVTVSLISTLPANDYEELICDYLNDGIETVKLEDFNPNIISNASNYIFTYYKSFSDADSDLTINKITTASNYKLILGENKIYVRINSNTPCYAIATLKLTLLSKPFIPIQDIVPICENKSILIDAGIGADNYLWSNGATSQVITVDNPGDFSVKVTKNYNTISCSSTKTFMAKTSNSAKITSIETQDWTDNNNTITVFVTGLGDYKYSIDGIHFQDSKQFSGLNSGEYTVHVRDKNGCGTATEEVYLLMYPKFFTPNGDGYNDTWNIKFSNNEASLTIKIFDRYGKLIKQLGSNSIGWDGTYTGQELPASDYWFVVTRENGKEYKGHFSLKR